MARQEQSGDWHDKPLKWQVAGPGSELQKFATKAEATIYKRIRSTTATAQDAFRNYASADSNIDTTVSRPPATIAAVHTE